MIELNVIVQQVLQAKVTPYKTLHRLCFPKLISRPTHLFSTRVMNKIGVRFHFCADVQMR